MDKLKQLVALSLKVTAKETAELDKSQLFQDFWEGKVTRVNIWKGEGGSLEVDPARCPEESGAKVLRLKRKNTEKINPRKILQDLALSCTSLPEQAEEAAPAEKNVALASVVSLASTLSSVSSLKLKDLLKASAMSALTSASMVATLADWREKKRQSLDKKEKDRAEYCESVFDVFERDFREIKDCSEAATLDRVRDTCQDFAQAVVALQTNEPDRCPGDKELRALCNSFVCDCVQRCEKDFEGKPWWETPALADRAKLWAGVFADLRGQLRLKVGRRGLEFRDPQLDNHIAWLEHIIDIYEIFRDAKQLAESNRAAREELALFKAKLAEGRGQVSATEVHKQLSNSSLLEDIITSKKNMIKQLSKSGQTLNALNSLSISAHLFRKNPALLKDEEKFVEEKVRAFLKEIEIEYGSVDASFVEFNERRSSLTTWPEDDLTISSIKALVSVQRKYQLVDRFNSTFFEEPKEEFVDACGQFLPKIAEKIDDLVQYWDERAIEKVVQFKGRRNERLLDLDVDAKVLTTNFSDELIVMIHMLDTLKELGLGPKINQKIHSFLREKKGILKEGVQLRTISEFYNSLGSLDSIMVQCHKPLLIDKIVELEELIQNANPNIENMPQELHAFIRKASDTIQRFEAENSSLKKTHAEIIADFCSLIDSDLINGHEVWKKVVKKAVAKVQVLSKSKPEKYVLVWTNALSWQLLKVLSYQVKTSLMNIASYMPKIESNVKLFQNKIVLYPSLAFIRAALYSQVDILINFPRSLSFFQNWDRMTESVPGECAKYLSFAYSQIDEILKKVEAEVLRLKKWLAVGCLDPSKISQHPALKNGEVWKRVVSTVKSQRREIEKQDEYVAAGCVRLKISSFKIQIDEKLTAVLDGMISEIDATMKEDKEAVEQFLDSLASKLDYQPQSTDELREAWETFDSIQVKMVQFLPNVKNLEDKVDLIKELGRIQPKAEQVLDRWRSLEARVKNFQSELRDKQEYMKGEIGSKVQQLKAELQKFASKWESVRINERETLSRKVCADYVLLLDSVWTSWADLKLQVERTKRDLAHFSMDERGLELFEELNGEIEKESAEWEVYESFEKAAKAIEEKKHVGAGKTVFEFQDFLTDWSARAKGRKSRVEAFLAKLIEDYQAAWPGFKLMIGESFQREHWNQLLHVLGIKGVTPDALTFGHLVEKAPIVLGKLDELKELSSRAQGEVTIREAIQELDNWCATAEFELMEYTDCLKRKVPLIREWVEMTAKVGDNQALLQSIKDSKFFGRFKDRITQFENKIGGLDRHLSKINNVQRRWLYLEPIFNKGALPSEKPRFQQLNDQFVEVMRTVEKNKKVALLSEINGLESVLNSILEQIEVCQSALNRFLEETRNRFPRFFFLGDDDLLEIVGQSENPTVIKLHLKKIFAGIFDVEFRNSPQGLTINSMVSSSGEVVELKNAVSVGANLEAWLASLEKEMFATLEDSLASCIKDTQLSISQFPGQVLGLAKEVDFSMRVLDAIEKSKLPDLKKHLDEFLDTLTKTKSKLKKVDQAKIKSLIMDVIHQISVVEELAANKVVDSKSWFWFKQLKYFVSKKSKKCQIMMCKAAFDYTYEYQGNPAKLVHTPLTDKCYLTLTQGMMLGFGGNPYGPAGTGKTESVKALGQAMARMVLVFNCDENLDYRSMGRIFIGLVKCGAWGCFDEFNRLIEEQLSAISQQIQIIQDAIREKRPSLHLLGKDVEVNFNAGIFVTLNPAGKGYGGRSKLPDNLKLLFRPVAMARPDNELIAEVMLFSEGFKSAKRLAKKIVNIFTLCNQLLSKQQHYDWGLRALKVILCTSGDLMELTRSQGDKAVLSSPKLEDEILMKALNDNTASKLTSEDLVKFDELVWDVLPDVKVPDINQESLIKAIEATLKKHHFEVQSRQLKKIIQFQSALSQRIGVVIMGPSGSGKTTIWSVLKEALQLLGTTVKLYVMNPKAISRNQLLGHMDPNTRGFHNGVLTAAARKVIKEPAQVLNWIICDGDVDPKWIEALNSVLDDNHLLTLPTGERIAFGSNVNFIFETHDLKFASPATVSRMGMIYLNNDDVDVASLVSKWKKEKAVREESPLNGFLTDYFEEIVKLVLKLEDAQVVKTTRMGAILAILTQLRDAENKKKFAIGAMRGLVANYPMDLRDEILAKLGAVLGEKLNFLTDFDEKQAAVVPLKTLVSEAKFGEEREPCVLTPYVQANIAIISKILQASNTLVLVGPEGGGKNTILRKAIQLLGQKGAKVKTVVIYCNSQTNSQQVIGQLLESCARSTNASGPILRPKDCAKLVLYLRDINLAKPDEYESTELISFLQQVHSHRGFYDEELEFTQIDKNVQFVVSMNPCSDIGRHEVSTRLTASTNILFVDYPTKEDMKTIAKHLVEDALSRSKQVAAMLKNKPSLPDSITAYLLEMFAFVKASFAPETQKHYSFTPKDISVILESVLNYETESPDELAYAVVSETNLTFRCRLVKPEELSKYDAASRKNVQAHLPGAVLRDTLFTSLLKKDHSLTKINPAGYLDLLARGLVGYQRENLEQDICFTDQIVELIQTLDKVLSRPGGKAILMGASGSARKLACHFVAHLLNIEFETFSPGKGYTLKEFRKELRRMLELAGFQGKKVCMYLETHHVLHPSFLEDINSLLSSNQVQGLFKVEEVEGALKDQLDELRNEFFGESVFDCFLLRIKKNFRAIFALDPKESSFTKHLTNNPALLKKCKIVWVQQPTSESLRKIAQTKLEEFFRETVGSAIDANLLESLIEIHRDLGANPREFFSAIDLFKQILEQKLAKTKHLTAHLFSGVEKIKAANQLVDQLSENASRQKRELRVKQEEAEKFLVKIQQTYESASDQKREAEEIREYLKKEEEKTLDKRQAIEEELAKVNPIVEEAKKQVRSINKGHIAELKSMANPPSQVDDVFQALFKVNGEGDVSWSYMKKALTNDSFFKQILAIDARSTLLLTSHHAQAPARGLRLRQEKPWLFREGRHLQGLAGRGPNRRLRAGAAEAGRDLRENQALRRPAQGTLG